MRSVETCTVAFSFSSRASSIAWREFSTASVAASRRTCCAASCSRTAAISVSSAAIWFLRARMELFSPAPAPPCKMPCPVITSPVSVTTAEPRICGKMRNAVARSGTSTVWFTRRSSSRATSGCGLILLMSQSIAPSGSCIVSLRTCTKTLSRSRRASDALPSFWEVSVLITDSATIVSFITIVWICEPSTASTAGMNSGATSMHCASAPWIAGLKKSALSRPRSTAWVPSLSPSPPSLSCFSTCRRDSRSASTRKVSRISMSSSPTFACASR